METKKFLQTMSKSFCNMRAATELVDVILVFGDAKIPCHKVVLAGTCDFFRAMFVTEMKESRSAEVQMSEISADIGLTLVNYLYSGNIEITKQNAQDLLAACNMLFLTDIKKDIAKFLSQAQEFLTKHWKELIDTEEMKELQEVDFVGLLKSLDSQEDRFRYLQKWVRLGGSGRDDRFNDLVEHVTLPKCSKEFICNVVMDEERMNHPKGMKLIQKAMQALMLADQPTKSSHESLVVANRDGNAWMCSDNKTWKSIEWHAHESTYFSGCSSPEGFIISGGHTNYNPMPQCSSYVALVKQWRLLPNMHIPRFAHASVYYQDKLYIIGGMESRHGYVDSVERLDAKTMRREDLCDLPQGTSTPLVVIVKHRLFVLGGVTKVGHSKTVLEFNFKDDTWDERSAMPKECRRGAAVEFNSFIYVVGGREQSCMRYDPRLDEWVSLQRTIFPHMFGPAMVWNDVIIVCGGEGTDVIEQYCPHSGTWSTWQLKLPHSGHLRFLLKIKS
ncbi:hypothetical protein CAPTEDRAFT_217135 [Capitella teleta]|uniref:BTB domain-containing protein n=1 Tax=Capitella teleta TaxID=283909 RepID=R7VK79_CAPTE|nr:hypothetical protein CAPTEDRAFT_217135 [Capitella teleta]|eukprot:ELU17111.1 hypothetical protein CAPTEDRAFT_217135 [Capitella teleta]